jgi:hypothetical protein
MSTGRIRRLVLGMLMLCRGGRIFSLGAQVPLERLSTGIRQLFEVGPVLCAHDARQRRVSQQFDQLNPLVQFAEVVHAGKFTAHRLGVPPAASVQPRTTVDGGPSTRLSERSIGVRTADRAGYGEAASVAAGQEIIATFGRDEYGESLFEPLARQVSEAGKKTAIFGPGGGC